MEPLSAAVVAACSHLARAHTWPPLLQGFTKEDIFEVAEYVGADGTSDVVMYIEVSSP